MLLWYFLNTLLLGLLAQQLCFIFENRSVSGELYNLMFYLRGKATVHEYDHSSARGTGISFSLIKFCNTISIKVGNVQVGPLCVQTHP